MSVTQVQQTIDTNLRRRGGKYAQYSCKYVSWDDVQRGTVGGGLSCWGGNITDTRLWERTGKSLFTVRSDNWNEKLGQVSSSDVALVVEDPDTHELKPITLRTFLQQSGQYGEYAGLPSDCNLSNADLDRQVSIRFQTTFLPVQESGRKRGTLEFCTEAYNYNTHSDDDPRNLVVLCTTQGLAVQQDGRGAKRLYHHQFDKDTKKIHRHWLEAERSDHQVGGPQVETVEEKMDAIARGKATSSVIGVRAMGTRFNVLMTIQIPLKQKQQPVRRSVMAYSMAPPMMGLAYSMAPPMMACSSSAPMMCDSFSSNSVVFKKKSCKARSRCLTSPKAKIGTSNAARVSKGSKHDTWPGLAVKNPQRDEHQHITVTVVIYNTVVGGVPSEADVVAAIDDMEELYKQCKWSGRLADEGADFMKEELTVKNMTDISYKVHTQPPPATQGVCNFDVFPTD